MTIYTRKQWINWDLRPGKEVGDNPIKFPLQGLKSPHTWMAYAEAKANGGIAGFWFTPEDPYFFLDIDHAWDGRKWSAIAVDLCRRFKGCYIEVSQSGTGLHIVGVGEIPPHCCKDKPNRLELYDRDRFIAWTGTNTQGDPDYAADPAEIAWLVETHFPKGAEVAGSVSVEDVPETRDDAEVLRLMLAETKPTLWDSRATACQLWVGDADALEAAYPPMQGGHGFDHSSADLALLNHLMYWTRGCRSQVERLFEESGLMREKWQRDDYRNRSLNLAWTSWKSRSVVAPDPCPEEVGSVAVAALREGPQFMGVSEQVDHFAGCVYIRDQNRIFTPDGGILDQSRFRAIYGGYHFAMDSTGKKPTRSAWEAFTESRSTNLLWAHSACFRPELPAGEIVSDCAGFRLVNTYVPIPTPSIEGDVSLFLGHLEKLLPIQDDRDILLAYMASLVQNPGVKFQWTPLVQGCEGNGKSLLIRVLQAAVGTAYTHLPNPADLGSAFNGWVSGTLFIGVEEVFTQNRMEISEPLKRLITDDRIEIQRKGIDQTTGDNRGNFLMCANPKDAVRKSHNDRRFCILYTAQQQFRDIIESGMGGLYFPKIYAWLKAGGYAAVTWFLQNYAIPENLDPARACHRAPKTSSTSEAVHMGLGAIEQEILEAVGEGRQGFKGGWISSMALGVLLKDLGRKVSRSKRSEILTNLGYITHPGLPGGRASRATTIDLGRTKLFIKLPHMSENILDPAEIMSHYETNQTS